VRKQILTLGIVGGLLAVLLQFVQYRFLLIQYSVEIYAGIVAAIFAGVGIWLGLKLTKPKVVVREVAVEVLVPAPVDFILDEKKRDALGITPRELEILQLIAEGLSNKEIADRANVSENTVKTHTSRVFDKLGAGRRTQAVQIGKELRLIP
jgi:NarL family two-component system response regulator LiaR